MSDLIIAGIGSRTTPQEEIDNITEIAKHVVSLSGWIRSGHADGADMAFELAAGDRCIAYLPWKGFNGPTHTKNVHWVKQAGPEAKKRSKLAVMEFHPAYDSIKDNQGVMKIMQRNYFQIHGAGEEEVTVDAVVCWTPADPYLNASGGTGQACRIADYSDVPIYNLYYMKKDFIISSLSKLANKKKELS